MSLDNKLQDLLHQKQDLEKELEDLKATYTCNNNYLVNLNSPEVTSLENKLGHLLYRNRNLEREIEELKHKVRALDHLETYNWSLQTGISSLEAKIQDLQIAFNRKDEDLLYLNNLHKIDRFENARMREELKTRKQSDADHEAAIFLVSQYASEVSQDVNMFWPLMEALKLMTLYRYPTEEIEPVAKAL